ncbi:MAG: NAD(P)-dependent malic enzyme [Candidatus Levyibacteriota bacterium]
MFTKNNALLFHKKYKGKIGTEVLTPIHSKEDLSLAYTPGVAEVSKEIFEHPSSVYDYTAKGHTVAIVTDGSAVLGLGNIGPEAALPVMEGKAALFKTFADVDAFPLCLNTQNPKEIVEIVKAISPAFGAINLEDIAAPNCFVVEEELQQIGIPVMHDDQHATVIVVLAGLINSAKVAGKKLESLNVVVLGAGAAGMAITKFLAPRVADIISVDSEGIIHKERSGLDIYKKALAAITNKRNVSGGLVTALENADVFIGVSKAGLFLADYIGFMAKNPIIFALANPTPEIMPDVAKKAGAFIIATGRSDFPNQINNCLAFPGVFKGLLMAKATKVTEKMKENAAVAIAGMVKNPTKEKIIPTPFEKHLADTVARAVASS